MKRSLLTAGIAGALLLLVACESTEEVTSQPTTQAMSSSTDTAMGMINDTCPVSGDQVDPSAKSTRYDGYKVGFCCNMCVKGWNRMSDDEKKTYVATQTKMK